LSTSTLRTSALAEATEREEASAKNSSANDIARLREHSTSPRDRKSVSLLERIQGVPSVVGLRSAVTAEEDGLPKIGLSDQPATQLSARCSPRTARHKVTTCDIAELIQGVTQVSSIVVAHEPQCHTAGALGNLH
jgi:hypothetical protein